jgi:NADH-quinone oxidoreductase subunit E
MSLEIREQALYATIRTAMAEHGSTREALIPILSEINRHFGYIPTEALGEIRRTLNDPEEGLFLGDSQVFAIASFYHMFSLKEVGKHVIRFCESTPCHVVGGREVIQAIQNTLGIQPGQTTPDRQWTLLMTSCLGVCAVGPVIMIDDDIYGNMTPEQAPEVLGRYA